MSCFDLAYGTLWFSSARSSARLYFYETWFLERGLLYVVLKIFQFGISYVKFRAWKTLFFKVIIVGNESLQFDLWKFNVLFLDELFDAYLYLHANSKHLVLWINCGYNYLNRNDSSYKYQWRFKNPLINIGFALLK